MLFYNQALELVLASVPESDAREFAIADALGLTLAREVRADDDMPSFDRSAMDGYAVRSDDTKTPGAKLIQIGEASAGARTPLRAIAAGECAAIYTGAAIPAGADAVVMVERTTNDNGAVSVSVSVKKGENIRFRGEDVKKGELLLKIGDELRPQEIAVCATFGAARVLARPRPRICILSTGDELVAPEIAPAHGQIRDSNGIMLAAQSARAGAQLVSREVVIDEPARIEKAILAVSAACDFLIMSGGVSMGARDHVPGILQKIGFAGGFHKIKMKPGKPIWFGRRGNILAFGLPGNPVSSFVTFELLVRPAIRRWLGREPGPDFRSGIVEGGPVAAGDREQFLPARVAGGKVIFIPWSSSADHVELARANALARVPIGAAPEIGSAIEWLAI
ncbi:MAG: molybdopterin molybdotransferase MoeA [Planctomycetes bacterium]|nr:molybdopterin molybdotransferase MoeA [Planctomycetota bacterium]